MIPRVVHVLNSTASAVKSYIQGKSGRVSGIANLEYANIKEETLHRTARGHIDLGAGYGSTMCGGLINQQGTGFDNREDGLQLDCFQSLMQANQSTVLARKSLPLGCRRIRKNPRAQSCRLSYRVQSLTGSGRKQMLRNALSSPANWLTFSVTKI